MIPARSRRPQPPTPSSAKSTPTTSPPPAPPPSAASSTASPTTGSPSSSSWPPTSSPSSSSPSSPPPSPYSPTHPSTPPSTTPSPSRGSSPSSRAYGAASPPSSSSPTTSSSSSSSSRSSSPPTPDPASPRCLPSSSRSPTLLICTTSNDQDYLHLPPPIPAPARYSSIFPFLKSRPISPDCTSASLKSLPPSHHPPEAIFVLPPRRPVDPGRCLASSASTSYGVGVLIVSTVALAIFFCSRMSMPLAAAGPLSMPPLCRDDDDIEASIDEVTLEAFPAVVHGEARKMRDRGAAIATTTQTCCPVCLVNYSDGDMLWVLLDCGHLFHRECVNLWLSAWADAACRGDAGRYGQAVMHMVLAA